MVIKPIDLDLVDHKARADSESGRTTARLMRENKYLFEPNPDNPDLVNRFECATGEIQTGRVVDGKFLPVDKS